jgi:amidohydrolase
LKEKQQDLNGTVKILFQPAEESSNGAVHIINTDILSDVKAIFGVHSAPDLAVGEVGIIVGPVTASVDRFEIEVTGVGAHAAHPDLGIDPIVISAHIITALQTIVSRNLDPFDTALISVTNLHSGSTWNVIPPTAYMEGTVRTLNAKTREFIPSRMRCIAEQVAAAFGAKAKLNWHPSTPATNNSKVWAEFAKQIAIEKSLQIAPYSVSLIGEDFAAYQEKIEGVFLFVGTGKNFPLHHPKFYVDTNAIIGSVEYFVHLAEQSMNRLA